MLQQYGGKFNDAGVQQYMNEIGVKLSKVTEGDNPQSPWEFTMLDSDVINAFSLPGGKVFFSRGLAAKLQNEAQFAGVLGHEIGHVTARHINDQMVHSTMAEVGTSIAGNLLEGYGGAAAQAAPAGSTAWLPGDPAAVQPPPGARGRLAGHAVHEQGGV